MDVQALGADVAILHDVVAVNAKASRELYSSRQKIHPKLTHGTFRTTKWAVMAVTLGIYYVLPWLRWNRGPDLPDQAVLLDLAHNRYFLFFFEIWPQEFYFVTGLLILASLALFLVTSVAGRVWCGYTCPQTVWTDLMIVVERFWQGDRNARIRLDQQPWTPNKIFKKLMTHLSWLVVALATGGAFVFYFGDAPTLARELLTGTAPSAAYVFLGIFTLTTYVLGGLAREQVCIYMCPWPRIQGAMTDRHTLLVSYQSLRGEPRGPHKKGESWEPRGDCIDCKACVVVCPTGIDIRDGSQLECIQCALCVDACNDVMAKVDRPRGLIAYATIASQEARGKGGHEPLKLIRQRTMLYASALAVVSAVIIVAWLNRSLLDVSVLRDRNPPFVQLTEGGVRNGYVVKILNKRHEPHEFVLIATGLPVGAQLAIAGSSTGIAPRAVVPTDEVRELRVLVTLSKDAVASLSQALTPFAFIVTDKDGSASRRHDTQFETPRAPQGRTP